MPQPVTREGPFYSNLKELRIPSDRSALATASMTTSSSTSSIPKPPATFGARGERVHAWKTQHLTSSLKPDGTAADIPSSTPKASFPIGRKTCAGELDAQLVVGLGVAKTGKSGLQAGDGRR